MTGQATPDLTTYDLIVVNSSGGKDSQAMLDKVVKAAKAAGVLDRVVVLHCDLGRVEWAGTRELAERQADHYRLPFQVRRKTGGDLLDQVWERHLKLKAKAEREGLDRVAPAWPSSAARYCTSDNKRDVAAKFLTERVRELNLGRQVRILNCMGFRAQESTARAKREVLTLDKRNTNGKREVWTWLPIHSWSADRVWARIKASGVPYHPAYDMGMPRLSCRFCVLASKSALVLSAQLNPELAQEYADLEEKMGCTFQAGQSMTDIIKEAKSSPRSAIAADWAA